MIGDLLSRQFFAFVLVGGLAACSNWGSRIVLGKWLPFGVAVLLAYIVGMSVAFMLNRALVFPRSGRAMARQARDFVATNLAFLPVVWGAALGFDFLLRRAGVTAYSQEIAHAFAIALPMVATFFIYKFVAFRED